MFINLLSKLMSIFLVVLIGCLAFIAVLFVLNIVWDLFGWTFKLEDFKIEDYPITGEEITYSRVDLFGLLLGDSYLYISLLVPFGLLTSIAMWVKSKAFKNYGESNFEV